MLILFYTCCVLSSLSLSMSQFLPPMFLAGVIRDASGSYAVSMWVLAGLTFISFLLWLLMPAAQAYERRRAESCAEP